MPPAVTKKELPYALQASMHIMEACSAGMPMPDEPDCQGPFRCLGAPMRGTAARPRHSAGRSGQGRCHALSFRAPSIAADAVRRRLRDLHGASNFRTKEFLHADLKFLPNRPRSLRGSKNSAGVAEGCGRPASEVSTSALLCAGGTGTSLPVWARSQSTRTVFPMALQSFGMDSKPGLYSPSWRK